MLLPIWGGGRGGILQIFHPYGVRKREYIPFSYRYATPTELRENLELKIKN